MKPKGKKAVKVLLVMLAMAMRAAKNQRTLTVLARGRGPFHMSKVYDSANNGRSSVFFLFGRWSGTTSHLSLTLIT